jgi:uncharacterized membrane protein
VTSERNRGVIRRHYLDWLRGIAVLIMIGGHTLDSWTRVADRPSEGYRWAMVIAGFGAPIFLFLAGVALTLAAASRLEKGMAVRDVARAALERGLWIFGLAFAFRMQSWIISGGAFPGSLLKVDILNIMGVALIAAAALWYAGRRDPWRAALFIAATIATAMLTPIVRTAPSLAGLADPVEWYLRPAGAATTFTLFPWAGFLTAGAAVGVWLARARRDSDERRITAALAVLGFVMGAGSYGASFLPPLFEGTSFWTTSPAFFFLRLGVLIAAVPFGYALTNLWRAPALAEFGRASLFVYWIHVEMVYGILSLPLHRRLPFGGALAAFGLFSLLLFGLVRLKGRWIGRGRSPEARRSGKTVLSEPTPSAALKSR